MTVDQWVDDPDAWVDAAVQVQGDSLVVMDAETGNCLVVEARKLFDHYDPRESATYPFERLESIFGSEVFAGE